MSGEKSPGSLQKSPTSGCVIVRARVRAHICTCVCRTHTHRAHDVPYFGVCRAACTHVCVQMCACVRACMRAHMHMRVWVCVCVRVRVQGNLRKLPRDFGAWYLECACLPRLVLKTVSRFTRVCMNESRTLSRTLYVNGWIMGDSLMVSPKKSHKHIYERVTNSRQERLIYQWVTSWLVLKRVTLLPCQAHIDMSHIARMKPSCACLFTPNPQSYVHIVQIWLICMCAWPVFTRMKPSFAC